MDFKMDSYSSCLLYLKERRGFSENDLSKILEVPQEVIQFFSDPEIIEKFDMLKEVLQQERYA